MSFSSMHNDYLDPDRHLWPDYDESEEAQDPQEEDLDIEDDPDPTI